MELDQVEQRILDLMKEGKTTKEIAIKLNSEGHRTAKGDIFLRKTVNNKMLLMRSKGALPKKDRKLSKMTAIKPHIYQATNGKIRIRKSVNGKLMCKTFPNLPDAEKYLEKMEEKETSNLVKTKKVVEPKVSRIQLPALSPINNFSDSNKEIKVWCFTGITAEEIFNRLTKQN